MAPACSASIDPVCTVFKKSLSLSPSWDDSPSNEHPRGPVPCGIDPTYNNFNLLLHETFGGGFSPTAVLKLRRLARKVARGSVDRTAYSPKYSLSFMSHHAERISLSVVRGVNRAIRSHLATLSARLARA